MAEDLTEIYEELFAWCKARGFAGSDPFDGLNSRIFKATPFRNYRSPRLALTQLVKRSPVDLRRMLGIGPGVNSKGIALFALAELSRFRRTQGERHGERSRGLLDQLLDLGIRDGQTLSFGYNFDWQSRVFYAPEGTPTIVPTAFASQALAEAADLFDDEGARVQVEEIARFAATRLNRSIETNDEICFSYTPIDRSVIFNASLLAAECLVRSIEVEHRDLASKAVTFVVRRQRDDGAWSYGDGASQGWVDNFHTAYVLQSIQRICDVIGWSDEAKTAFDLGMRYWLGNFFLEDGTPKYYDHETYPVDIHSAAVAISALAELDQIDVAFRVTDWTIRNMRDVDGFFYYRVGRILVDETPHMRWGQAWMAYALARLVESTAENA
jgi:hypothetical protein